MKKILVIGAGGHSKVIIEILKYYTDIKIEGILDDKYSEYKYEAILDIPLIGVIDDIEKYLNEDYMFALAIGNNVFRKQLYDRYRDKLISVIHKSAIISESSFIGQGTFIGAGVIINSNTTIGSACIINTGCIVEHDCVIEDFAHLSSGVILSGGAKIKEGIFVSAGNVIGRNKYITEDIND